MATYITLEIARNTPAQRNISEYNLFGIHRRISYHM